VKGKRRVAGRSAKARVVKSDPVLVQNYASRGGPETAMGEATNDGAEGGFGQEDWCRRRESEFPCALKTGNLLTFSSARNARYGKIAANWNVSGTRICSLYIR